MESAWASSSRFFAGLCLQPGQIGRCYRDLLHWPRPGNASCSRRRRGRIHHYKQVNFPAFVYIDNQPVKVSFAGLTPGFVSLYQINATVSDGITRGATVALDVEIDNSDGDTLAYTSEAKIAIAPNL